MARLTRDDFFNTINQLIGDDTTDERLQILDNLTDTYLEMEQNERGDGTDWQTRYEENDKAWKEKYRRRFTAGKQVNSFAEPQAKDTEEPTHITIADLFS